MIQNCTKLLNRPFEWTGARERAVALVGEDTLTNQEIATALGIGRATLTRWKHRREFKERVAEYVKHRSALS